MARRMLKAEEGLNLLCRMIAFLIYHKRVISLIHSLSSPGYQTADRLVINGFPKVKRQELRTLIKH